MKFTKFKNGSLLRTSWAEMYTIFLGVIGFILALSIKSPMFSYIVIILSGFMCGRLLYQQRRTHQFPSYMIVFGLLLGYIIGSHYTNRKMLLFIAVIAMVASYYSHSRDMI
jgi:hypothetical protein